MSDPTTDTKTPTVEELQAALNARDAAFNPLKDENAALKKQLADRELADARAQLVAANPDVPAELIAGDTAEALNASVASAKAVAAKVRQQIAETTDIPAGGGAAPAIDPYTLPPDERIRWGIANADKIQRTNTGEYEKGERR
jgi:hypothetical protein